LQATRLIARKRVLAERANTLKEHTGKEVKNVETLFAELADIAIGLALGCILEGSGMYRDDQDGAQPDHAYSRCELKQICEHLRVLVDSLEERERLIVKLHYFHGIKFEEIATEMNLSKGRISQLHHVALKHLREIYEQATGIDKKF
jgi:RNA polymerase sigma factor for flagellar operon FliA